MNTSSDLLRRLRRVPRILWAPTGLALASAGLLTALAGCAASGGAPASTPPAEAPLVASTKGEPAAAAGVPAKPAGAEASTFTLPNAAGQQVSLADLTRRGPAVVFFYRGAWCPSCREQLRQLNSVAEALTMRGVGVAAISVDVPEVATKMTKRIGLQFPLLRDEELDVARAYGAAGEDDEFPQPALVVIRKDGRVQWKQVGELGTDRSFADQVVQRATEAGAGPAH